MGVVYLATHAATGMWSMRNWKGALNHLITELPWRMHETMPPGNLIFLTTNSLYFRRQIFLKSLTFANTL
jgi:hypothetical protein